MSTGRRLLQLGAAVLVWATAAVPALAVDDTRPPNAVIDLAPPRVVDLLATVVHQQGGVRQYDVTQAPQRVDVNLSADVLFEFDRADLTPAANRTLDEVAAMVRQRAKGPISITGYTDSKGDPAYNLDLSRRRAAAVQAALAARLGDPALRYVTEGKGEADPVAPNARPDGSDNPEGRRLNRRVTISFPT